MGFNCVSQANRKIYFDTNISNWSLLLQLGARYGWEPKGTEPPAGYRRRKWNTSYSLNMGQVVGAEDAKAWGAAILRAIYANPVINTVTGERLLVPGYEQRLRAFIALCDAGSFEIW